MAIPKSPHPADFMAVTIAHLLQDGERVFHGVSSQLPRVAILLAKAMDAPNMTVLNIPGGVNPKGSVGTTYSSAGSDIFEAGEAVFSLGDIFDLSMRGGLDVAFLGGVQFDATGNVNASLIGTFESPKVRLPGGAGSAVLIPTAKKAILWRTKHDVKTFVEKVDFITTSGNVYRIVTPLGMFAKIQGRLILVGKHPQVTLEEIQRQTGFAIDGTHCVDLPLPTDQELSLLKRIDPKGARYGEF